VTCSESAVTWVPRPTQSNPSLMNATNCNSKPKSTHSGSCFLSFFSLLPASLWFQ
jgi:hypothetical protein